MKMILIYFYMPFNKKNNCLITYGKTLEMMYGLLQFINHCHCIVLHRDMTVAVSIYNKIILTETEYASPFTRFQCSCWREEYPIDIMLIHQRV